MLGILLCVAAAAAQALEIRDGNIRFAEDVQFYNNRPDTLLAALVDPNVCVGSKESMILRMARDRNLPADRYEVLFHPSLHSDRDLTAALMRVLAYFRPEDVSRLSAFPFMIEVALETLLNPWSPDPLHPFKVERTRQSRMTIYVGFLDQVLTWVEGLAPENLERANDLRKYSLSDINAASIFRFAQIKSRNKSDFKQSWYDFYSCGIRMIKILMKMGAITEAKSSLGKLRDVMPLKSYVEEDSDFESECDSVRSEVRRLENQLLRSTAPSPAPAPAPAAPEVSRPPEPTSSNAEERALLAAIERKDNFALIDALNAFQEGEWVSAAVAMALHQFIANPPIEMSDALRQMAQQFVRPQLSRHLEQLAEGDGTSPDGKALMQACAAALLYRE